MTLAGRDMAEKWLLATCPYLKGSAVTIPLSLTFSPGPRVQTACSSVCP